MRKHIENVEWFLLWSVAFYAIGLGYVFEARGAIAPALAATMVAVLALACCWATAVRIRLHGRR